MRQTWKEASAIHRLTPHSQDEPKCGAHDVMVSRGFPPSLSGVTLVRLSFFFSPPALLYVRKGGRSQRNGSVAFSCRGCLDSCRQCAARAGRQIELLLGLAVACLRVGGMRRRRAARSRCGQEGGASWLLARSLRFLCLWVFCIGVEDGRLRLFFPHKFVFRKSEALREEKQYPSHTDTVGNEFGCKSDCVIGSRSFFAEISKGNWFPILPNFSLHMVNPEESVSCFMKKGCVRGSSTSAQ